MLSLARKMSSVAVPPAKILGQNSYLVSGTDPVIHKQSSTKPQLTDTQAN